ncbi:MAG: DUF3179 domain-containing protein [Planctomycetia bacterium]|nr:DUF3179 domain-containing protein [Planctomycetia bacterium]
MSQDAAPQSEVAPGGSGPKLQRAAVLASLAVLLAFIVSGGRHLWAEWSTLRVQELRLRNTVAIGYPGINPRMSYAAWPDPWIHDDAGSTRVWSGWKQEAGHQWFRVGLGEVRPASMSPPLGRDVIQAIDVPVVERQGGPRWSRIPDEAFVVGQRLGGVDNVYPLLVLDKVFVVNDTIDDHPYLVANNPLVPLSERVAVYETVVDGRRVTMGLTGYFYDGKPLLYDRGTESFWVGESDALRAIAGTHRGRRLRRIARPVPVAWGDWRSEHPDSRLVIGADRSRPRPAL